MPLEPPVDDSPLVVPLEPPLLVPLEPPVDDSPLVVPLEPPLDVPLEPPLDVPLEPPLDVVPLEPPLDVPLEPPLDVVPLEPPLDVALCSLDLVLFLELPELFLSEAVGFFHSLMIEQSFSERGHDPGSAGFSSDTA